MGSPEPDYIAESFGILVPEGGLRPCLAELLPGENRERFFPEKYSGVEMCYILRGHLDFDRDGERHTLNPRDMMYVSGETERSYHCTGEEPVQALIISFDEDSPSDRRMRRRNG